MTQARRLGGRVARWLGSTALVLAAVAGLARGAGAVSPEGFGAATPGGAGGDVVRVTTLADSGPGSLRAALAGGHRTVVFDVAGDIALSDEVRVRGPHVTIDGTSAPAPGITLRGHGLFILGSEGAHDVIVRGLRVRSAADDGIHVARGAYNVLIEGVSVHGSGDGNLDITEASDVTVAWSIFAEPAGAEKNVLIKYAPSRVTLHHNLLVGARQRNPQVRIDDAGTPATTTTLDMRNNVVWDWRGGYGTLVWYGPRANIVGNFYGSPASPSAEQAKAIEVSDGGQAYVEGNVSGDGLAINAAGTEGAPFPATHVTTQSACEAAVAVLGAAGVRPLDALDGGYVSEVALGSCASVPLPPGPTPRPDLVVASLVAPGSTPPGAALSLTVTTRNAGTAGTDPSTTRLYLSREGAGDDDVVAIGAVAVPDLAPGATSSSTLGLMIPGGTSGGRWRLVARSDADGVVAEADEGNNAVAVSLLVVVAGRVTWTDGDLTVSGVNAPSRAEPGETIAVAVTIKNRGTALVPASSVVVYLGSESHRLTAALRLGVATVPALEPGASVTVSMAATVPPWIPPGSYLVIATADARYAFAEAEESNNSRVKTLIVR